MVENEARQERLGAAADGPLQKRGPVTEPALLFVWTMPLLGLAKGEPGLLCVSVAGVSQNETQRHRGRTTRGE